MLRKPTNSSSSSSSSYPIESHTHTSLILFGSIGDPRPSLIPRTHSPQTFPSSFPMPSPNKRISRAKPMTRETVDRGNQRESEPTRGRLCRHRSSSVSRCKLMTGEWCDGAAGTWTGSDKMRARGTRAMNSLLAPRKDQKKHPLVHPRQSLKAANSSCHHRRTTRSRMNVRPHPWEDDETSGQTVIAYRICPTRNSPQKIAVCNSSPWDISKCTTAYWVTQRPMPKIFPFSNLESTIGPQDLVPRTSLYRPNQVE